MFRADAAFAKRELYKALKERDVKVRDPPPRQQPSPAEHYRVIDAASGNVQPQAGGPVQELSLSGVQLEGRRGGWWRRRSSISGNCSPSSASS